MRYPSGQRQRHPSCCSYQLGLRRRLQGVNHIAFSEGGPGVHAGCAGIRPPANVVSGPIRRSLCSAVKAGVSVAPRPTPAVERKDTTLSCGAAAHLLRRWPTSGAGRLAPDLGLGGIRDGQRGFPKAADQLRGLVERAVHLPDQTSYSIANFFSHGQHPSQPRSLGCAV